MAEGNGGNARPFPEFVPRKAASGFPRRMICRLGPKSDRKLTAWLSPASEGPAKVPLTVLSSTGRLFSEPAGRNG